MNLLTDLRHSFRQTIRASLPGEEVPTLSTTYELSSLADEQVALFAKQGTREMAEALEKISAQRAVSPTSKKKWKTGRKASTVSWKTRGRLRENMKALRGNAEEKVLVRRYTKQPDEQETQCCAKKIQDTGGTARQSQPSTGKDDRRPAHRDLHVVISSETLPHSCRGLTCPNWQVAPNAHFFAKHELPAAHDLHSKGSEKASPRGRIFPKRSRRKATGEAPKMRRIVLFRAILLLALVTARSVAAGPQKKGTATLAGVVLGPDDRPVPHAAVTYQSSGGNAPHAVHADAHGHFTITKLRADNYDMRASGKGVFSEWQKNITVHSGQTKNVTLRLIYAKEVPKAYVKTKPNPQ